ncbi:carbohydrate-binding protein [Limoniibacter endophyticus]|uniref:Uncharacterized protein n=1 Tax=Limoniibacter endophyticus TaxID=1565040 RepID=A0A8J3GGG6_9HYPH|nr:carbohydrate-binding protein [Limoniibacter endophyticus]GHC72866.1 hypothetical protein GCM10010136_20880 [Limoniibacter endophyticus]
MTNDDGFGSRESGLHGISDAYSSDPVTKSDQTTASFTIEVRAEGNHPLTIRYANGWSDERTAILMLDGVSVQALTFPPTGSWATSENLGIRLQLSTGSHLLQIVATNGAGPDVTNIALGEEAPATGLLAFGANAFASLNLASIAALALTSKLGEAQPPIEANAAALDEPDAAAGNAETSTPDQKQVAAAQDGDAPDLDARSTGALEAPAEGPAQRAATDTPPANSDGGAENSGAGAGAVSEGGPLISSLDMDFSRNGSATASNVQSGAGAVSPSPLENGGSSALSPAPSLPGGSNSAATPDGTELPAPGEPTNPTNPSEPAVQPPVDQDDTAANDDEDDDTPSNPTNPEPQEPAVPTLAESSLRIQAENAAFGYTSTGNLTTDPTVVSVTTAGASDIPNADAADGDAYVDFAGYNGNNNAGAGQYIEWTFTVDEAGVYDIGVGYAFFSAGVNNRPMRLDVNGQLWDRVFDFKTTGANTTYSEATTRVALQAGENTIRLTANGFSGPNIDYLEIREADPNMIVVQAESLATQVGSNTNGAINRPIDSTNTPSSEIFRFGAEGESYLEWAQNSATQASMTIDVPVSGTYTFAVTYANGGTTDRPLQLYGGAVSGNPLATLQFASTRPNALTGLPNDLADLGGVQTAPAGANGVGQGWEGWSVETITVHLEAGQNTLILSGAGVTTGPNIDKFVIKLLEADTTENTPPTALSLDIDGVEDTQIQVDIAELISDAEDEALTITASVSAEQGAVSVSGTIITFTPPANFNGSAQISYTVTDSQGLSDTATVNVAVAAVNDAPTLSGSLAAQSVAAGTEHIIDLPLTAADVDSPTVSLFIANADALQGFSIVDGKLVIAPSVIAGTYAVSIAASDGSLTSEPIILNLTVTPGPVDPENNAPQITTEPGFTVNENMLSVGQVIATDLDGDSLTYTLTGTDAAKFTIDANGNISLIAEADFEQPDDADGDGIYSATVTVSDGVSTSAQDIQIEVADVNEAPNSISFTGNDSFVENVTHNTVLGTVDAADPDGDQLTFSVSDSRFFINEGGQLIVAEGATFDFDEEQSLEIVVTATDGEFTATQSFNFAITEAPDVGPEEPVDPHNVVFDPAGLTPYSTQDSGPGGTITDDGSTLNLDGNFWKRAALGESYTITENTKLTLTVTVGGILPEIIAVGFDDDELPFEMSDKSIYQIAGSQGQSSFVDLRNGAAGNPGEVITLTIDLSAHAGKTINSLVFIADDDQSSNGVGSVSFSSVQLAEVAPENTAPSVVGGGFIDMSVNERATLEVDLPFVDADGDALSYSLAVSDAQGGAVSGFEDLTFENGVLSGPVTALPGTYTIVVTASDGRGGSAVSDFVLTVADVNDAPIADSGNLFEPLEAVTGQEVSIDIAMYGDAFSDADGDELTFTVEGLPDGLSLNEEGVIVGTPTQPGSGFFTIIATDPLGLSASLEIAYNVEGEPIGNTSFTVEAEAFTGLSSATGFYASAATTASGDQLIRTNANQAGSVETVLSQNGLASGWYTVTITVFDETDGNASFTLKIGDTVLADNLSFNDNGTFNDPSAIRGNAAQAGNLKTITFTTPVFVDAATIAQITGQADNGEYLRIDKLSFTSTDAPLEQAPSAITLTGDTISENAAAGVIGTLSAIDPDGDSNAIVYSTTDERFVIEGNTIRLADGVSLDHEEAETVTVSVVATDTQGLSTTTELTINVGDVNEAPELAAGATVEDVALDAGEGTTIDLASALGATDPDAGDSVSYIATLANGAPLPAGFSLENGTLTIASDVAAGVYAISAAASDGEMSSEPVTFTVTVGEPAAFTPIVVQAEDAQLTVLDNDANTTDTTIRNLANPETTAGLVDGLRPDYSGTGYLDFGDFPGDSVTFTVTVSEAGTYDLNVRYASVNERPLSLSVNNGTVSTMPFPDTSVPAQNGQPAIEGFNNWEFSTVGVQLVAGVNTITLAIPAGANTGPNIDRIELTEGGSGPIPQDTSADADEIPLFLSGPQEPLSGAAAESINFNLAGIDADIVKVEMSFDGGTTRVTVLPDTDGDYAVDGSALAAGSYTAIAYVTDAAGNQAQSQMNIVIAGPVVIAPFTIQAEDETKVMVQDSGTGDSDASLTREVSASRPDATGNYRTGAVDGAYIDFGTNAGDGITFNIDAPAAGTYLVTFRYANGGTTDRPLALSVNGSSEGPVSFVPGPVVGTGSEATGWNSWVEKTVEITLAEGANTVSLEIPAGATAGPNIDQATFEYVDEGNPSEPFLVTIEAETFTVSDVEATASTPADTVPRTPENKEPNANTGNSGPGQIFDADGLRPGYEGSGYLDMGNDIGDQAGFNITVEEAGTYQLTVRYANGGDANRPMTLSINGVTQLVNFNSTVPAGGTADQGWSTWVDVTIDVQLNAGINAISLANTITNGPNIDNVTISRDGDDGPGETRDLIRFEEVVKINFQPASGQTSNGLPAGYQTPQGFLADVGLGFGDRGNGFSYGWVTEESVADGTTNGTIAANQPTNAHWYKNTVSEASDLQKTYAHFEMPGSGVSRAWEMALANGTYQVTMSIGDTAGAPDSTYAINVEGQDVMPDWVPTAPNGNNSGAGYRSTLVTTIVTVTDGRLTIDSIGGTNTEIQYLEIDRVPDLTPDDGVPADQDFSYFVAPVAASLEDGQVSIAIGPNGELPTGIDPTSTFVVGINLQADGNRGPNIAYTDNIKLVETLTGIEVPVSIQISGGADTLNIRPLQDLKENTSYTLKVQDVMDLGSITDPDGPLKQFQDLTTTFVTGTAPVDVPREVAFTTDVLLNGFADGAGGFTTVEFGPDGKLYVATITGEIHRWTVNANGTIDKASQETLSLSYLDAGGGERRGIVGFVFDPNDPNTIWITDNAPIPRESKAFDTPEFSGRVSKITLADNFQNSTAEAYITGLPRSGGDHLTNSLEFRQNPDYSPTNGEPEYLLYLSQGSNSAAGAADGAWGNRPERLLNAAILEIDPTRTPPSGGFSVQTEPSQAGNPSYQSPAANFNIDGTYPGFYNPYASDAVLSIYATGVRNAYDLVWHSNGKLYVPTNGTASGGKTPTDPTQPGLDTTISNSPKQYDYFFTIDEGKYYGHPNVLRDEYILNGGNPTGGSDPNEVVGGNDGNSNTDGYQSGVQPDADYDLDGVYNLGYNQSPNGAVEYTGNAFGSNLKGAVLFAQFSTGDNVRYIQVDAEGNIIGDDVLRRPDGSVIDDYIDPLDIIQNPVTGQLYLMTLNRSTGASQLILLTPAPGGVSQDLTADEGNDLTLVALDVSDPAAAIFRIDGLDSDITAIRISFNNGPKQTITIDAQKQFTIDLGALTGPVTATIEVTDDALNTATASSVFVPGEEPSGEDFVSLVTIQAEDKTPADGTSVTVATGTGAQIQIRDASNPEAAGTAGTVNGLRPGAYGTDGNTNGDDGVPGGYADFGSTNADFLTFNFSVPADQAGNAILRFRYANGSTADRPLQLEINGNIIKVQSFLPTTVTDGSDPWNNWQTVDIPVVLTGGANTVTVRSVNNTGPNIDQLEILVPADGNSVPNDGEMIIDGITYVKYEAENADLGGAAIVTEDRNQSGGAFVDYVGTADQSVSWTISTSTSGSYNLDVLYALASTKTARPMTISVNGVVVQTLPFLPNSNASETTWGPQSVTLDLAAGTNVITLTAPDGNGPNLDYMRVTKTPISVFEPDYAEIDGSGRIELEATDGSANTVNGSTVDFYFTVNADGVYKIDTAANLNATNGQGLRWFLNGVEVDTSPFPGAGTAGEESVYLTLQAGQNYQLRVISNAPGANGLDYLDIQPAPGNPNAEVTIHSLDAAYFDDRLHFSYLENPDAVSPGSPRDFKDDGTVRISNTGTEPLTVTDYQLTGPFVLQNPNALNGVTIAPGAFLDVTVLFNRAAYTPPTSNVDGTSTIFEGQLKIVTNDQDSPVATVKLAGFWQARDEGGQEPNVNEIWKIFGFGNVIEGLKLTGGGENSVLSTNDVFAKTDETEVLSPYWKIADGFTSAKITQIAAFHGPGGATIGIHNPGTKNGTINFWDHQGNDNQRLLPNAGNDSTFATKTFTRTDVPDGWQGADIFGISVAGLSSDPRLNPTGGVIVPGAQQGHTVKIFQALDGNGDVIPNVYLGVMDYTGINYDYNDNLFVIEGVEPVGFGADMVISGLDDAAADDRLVFTNIDQPANAQQTFRNEATLTLTNDGFTALSLSSLVLSDSSAFEFVGPVPTSIAAGASAQITIRFKGTHAGTASGADLYNATLTINSNDYEGAKVIQLAGLAQEFSENNSEPTVAQIVEAFGYTTDVAQGELANGGQVETVGDEVLMPYLEKLDPTKNVEIIQMAAFLQQGNVARLGYHQVNSSAVTNLFANDDQQGQTVLPDQLVAGSGAGASVARGTISQNTPFGLFISVDGRPTYSSWTDPEANKIDPNFGQLVGEDQGHLIRFFEALDADGNVIPGTYIAIQDYPGAGNYDYNDHMFVIKNVKPHTLTSANDANGDGINDALQLDADNDGTANFFDNTGTPPTGPQTPYPGPAPTFTNGVLTVDATNFDNGGQGISWNDNAGLDNPTGNPSFRPGRDVELVGAGLDIGHVKPGEWVEYTIDVPTAGTYSFSANAKTPVSGATISVSLNGQTQLGTVTLADGHAGGSNFSNAAFADSAPISLNLAAGIQTLRLTFNGPLASNGYVLDLASFKLTAPVNPQTPYPGAAPTFTNGTLTVDATNFDNGGQGISWNDNAGLDNPTSNPSFRSGRDVELVGAGLDIGHVKPGEWVEYTINVPTAGTYTFSANAKTPVAGATIGISLNGQTQLGTVSLADGHAGGSDFGSAAFAQSAPISFALDAGIQTLRLTFNGPLASNGYVLDLASFTLTAPSGQTPFGGVAPVLSDAGLVIDAVDYDEGGQGVAYNDAAGLQGGTNGGRGGSSVEVTSSGDVGWIANGEWMEYTITVEEAGTYAFNANLALGEAGGPNRTVTASFTNGSAVDTVTVNTPRTGTWSNFQDSNTVNVDLDAGTTVIRLTFNGGAQDISSFSLEPVASPMQVAAKMVTIDAFGDATSAQLLHDDAMPEPADTDVMDHDGYNPDLGPVFGYDLLT